MSNQELDVLVGVVTKYYPSEINDSGNWKPAKLVVDTDEAFGVEVSFWPKKDKDKIVIEPIQIPVLDAIDVETIEGKDVQVVCIFDKIYKKSNGDTVHQYTSARKVKIVGEDAAPKPKPELEVDADGPVVEAPAPIPVPRTFTIGEQIAWNSAINNACATVARHLNETFEWGSVNRPYSNPLGLRAWASSVHAFASVLYPVIKAGPPEPVEAPAEEEPEQEESDGVIDVDGQV